MKTVLLVLARQGSKRLPLKHLYPLVDGRNALELVRERLNSYPGIPGKLTLFVGTQDFLYEDLGEKAGYSNVIRTGAVADGDLLSTLWEGSIGFERGIVVYGDSPLINSHLIRDLLAHTGGKEFGWVEGVHGLRPFVFHREFLREWIGRVYRERTAPFSLLRWPGLEFEPLRLEGKAHWALDTRDDLRHLREMLATHGPLVSIERILKCS